MAPTPGPSSSRRQTHRTNHTPGQQTLSSPIAPTLPPYEPPIGPLNPAGKRAIASLLETRSLRNLHSSLANAADKLTDATGDINERYTDAKVRHEAKVRRRREREAKGLDDNGENNDGWDEDNERMELEDMEKKVKEFTTKMEGLMRRTIDREMELDVWAEGLRELVGDEDENADDIGRRVRRRVEGRDDEEQEEEEELGDPPSQLLKQKIARNRADWGSRSFTDRFVLEPLSMAYKIANHDSYSTHNRYIGFYRVLHDAQYADDEIPPLPHSSTWFAHLEPKPSPSRQQPQAQQPHDSSPTPSDDFTIERERISLKCPLTLLMFTDPVTSTKCPHSFEREAIMGMLAQSRLDKHVPGAGRRNRVRYIRCPVCSLELTGEDLRSDPVLLRKVKRAQEMSQRVEEEAEFHGERSRITLGSDDDSEEENEDESGQGQSVPVVNPVRIKRERAVSAFRGLEDDDDGDGV